MKRYLPFLLIAAAALLAAGAGAFLYFKQTHRIAGSLVHSDQPGARPPHVRGPQRAPAVLEEFGDFECLPCFIVWPALRNLEKDYGDRLSVTFRESPLPQHDYALPAARAAEAAGLQDHFWEMHDTLYLSRAQWIHGGDIHTVFDRFAERMGLDLDRFNRDMDGPEVAARIAADRARAASLGIDRTPVLYVNGQRIQLQDKVEEGIRSDIEAALKR